VNPALPYYGMLLLSIAMAAGAQLLWKRGAAIAAEGGQAVSMFLSPWILIGFGIYGLSAAIYVLALRKIPLAVAYPSIALGYVVVVIASWLLFGEALTLARMGALVLICAGVALLWVGS